MVFNTNRRSQHGVSIVISGQRCLVLSRQECSLRDHQ